MICVLQNRWVDAVRELGAVTSQPEGGPDRLVRYRAEVLSAWAGIGGGIPTPTVVGHLEAASRAGVTDPAFTGFFEFAYGEARGRTHGVAGLRAYTADLPQAPLQVPEASTYLLAFRGLTRSAAGFFPEAIADLSEVEKRFRVGLRNLGDGVSHAHLGMSLWMAGDWRLADTKFRIARDLRHEIPNPMTIALTAFEPVRRADFAAARALLDELGADLAKQPWQEAVDFFLSALVVLLHAEGDPAAQSRARAEFARTFGRQALELRDPVYPFWLVNRALLSLWAGDEADAERIVQALAGLDWKPVWARGAEHWLRGLIAEVRGLTGRARREFDDAVAGGIAEFPLLHAHVLFDRARVARDAASLQASQALYRRLGQLAYLERFSVSPETPAVVAGSALAGLSDRERDVVALLAEGFSYAQIARDLYITRSTVAFHLSNIYAKTGVTSRHALTELVRTVG
jgi:DNA-binding CsgD family transcriptional regulator